MVFACMNVWACGLYRCVHMRSELNTLRHRETTADEKAINLIFRFAACQMAAGADAGHDRNPFRWIYRNGSDSRSPFLEGLRAINNIVDVIKTN